jgi:serine/threonine protein kinase
MEMNYLYLIFELCNGGDLQACLKEYMQINNKPFTQEIVQHLMRQIISGFVYLHGRNILHRDIKLENILVKFPTEKDKENLNMLKCEIRISDFGFSRYLKAESLAKSVLGNPINMDPAILKKLRRMDNNSEFGYDQKADIWSLGTITYELLIGCPAFEANSYEELLEKIEKGNYKIPHEIILSKEAICFLNSMMQYDPNKRFKVEDLAKQFFLTKDVKTFRPLQLKKTQMDLAQSIILNSRDEKKSNINNIFGCFSNEVNPEDYNPDDTLDNISICNIPKMPGIKVDQEDIIQQKLDEQKMNENYNVEKNVIDNKPEKMDNNMSRYLHNCFDEMNKDCFYIEPLLIPTQPSDSYNSEDPISKFMENL